MSLQVKIEELDFCKPIKTNDLFSYYNGTSAYTDYGNYMLTDGVTDIAKETSSFWFLDVIISHQLKLKEEEFQSWTLIREMELTEDGEVESRTNVFMIICSDGNYIDLKKQKVPFSDFPYDSYTIWLQNGVLFLPSEN
jgi:hypothetical protein